MNNPTLAKRLICSATAGLVIATTSAAVLLSQPTLAVETQADVQRESALSAQQRPIPLIAAFVATSDMPRLRLALGQGLDAGLTLSQAKEIIAHLSAYVGFPRSLNAMTELMNVVKERRERGIQDLPGSGPSRAVPTGEALLAVGAANQTRVAGAPVKGPLFDFAPVMNQFLQAHLFGDMFERDNLDWKSRELATVGALAATPGVEAQLRSHMRASINVGLTVPQLRQLISVLAAGAEKGAAERASTALDYQLAQGLKLTYGGAITENVAGKVNIHTVSYQLNGLEISANIYTPANYDPEKTYPAVVIAHPNGGVKEQVAGLYAQRLAELGYITIAADAAYQGASGGQPRNIDKPAYRIEDIHGMADYILRYAGVDGTRVGLLGICGGGGYSLKAAQTDKRFKSVATVSMFNSGRVRRNGFMDSQIATIQERLQQASDARALEGAGGKILYANEVQLSDEQIAKLPFEMYRQGLEYYGKTHAHPNSSARFTLSSLLDLMSFDATNQIELVNKPLLMIAGSKADSLYMTEEAFGKATGTKDKELYKIDGATHIETYWVPKYVDVAVEQLEKFYKRTL